MKIKELVGPTKIVTFEPIRVDYIFDFDPLEEEGYNMVIY